MSEHTCEKCGGKGATVVVYSEEVTQVGGVELVSSGSGTVLCSCRSALPPRDGKAAWWTLRTVYEQTVGIPIGNEAVQIEVKTEVPVSRENFPVVTRGNRYYPTTVDLEIGRESLNLHGDTARELAARLIEAADACDRCDLPDTDTCGHWAPCDCGRKEQA